MDSFVRKIKHGNRVFTFNITSADIFTVEPPTMNREVAESIVWGIIVQPNHKVKRGRHRRRGGVKGA